jgi:UDP-GlcNAc:undecaprenyl-phosphate/decaprenyl-phosphate GlcNAc-1-phosphate transferase
MVNFLALEQYIDLLPVMGIAFIITFILTPFVGYIANKLGFIDLPALSRRRNDPSISQRIHKESKPRLGGIAVIIPFIILSLYLIDLNQQLIGMYLGLAILVLTGVIDDKYELSGAKQFAMHFLAAIVVVISGTTITQIQFAGMNFDFVMYENIINIFGFVYTFIFPADIITILWIMTIINAINWVCGIDALGETTTLIVMTTIMMLCFKLGQPQLAIIPAILIASILGFLPYNFPPSKIIGGTVAHTSFGYLIAVLAMISGAKITSMIILTAIPLIDMIWVIIYRIRHHNDVFLLKRPFVSGRIHLHHRLMSSGFSTKQTLFIETTAMITFGLIAFYIAGFSPSFLIFSGILVGLFVLISMITLLSKFRKSNETQITKSKIIHTPDDDTVDPQQRFAY